MIDEKKLIERIKEEPTDGMYTHEIIEAIEEQPKIGEWIPCSERMPECDGEYICTQEIHSLSSGKVVGKTVELVEFCNGAWRRAKHLKVIAWQPLPVPYEVESDE